MATRQDTNITKCAARMVAKIEAANYTANKNEFPKGVQIEIERMKHLCRTQPIVPKKPVPKAKAKPGPKPKAKAVKKKK